MQTSPPSLCWFFFLYRFEPCAHVVALSWLHSATCFAPTSVQRRTSQSPCPERKWRALSTGDVRWEFGNVRVPLWEHKGISQNLLKKKQKWINTVSHYQVNALKKPNTFLSYFDGTVSRGRLHFICPGLQLALYPGIAIRNFFCFGDACPCQGALCTWMFFMIPSVCFLNLSLCRRASKLRALFLRGPCKGSRVALALPWFP